MAGDSPLNMMPPLRGVIFFAHGSRDPLWSAPIEAAAQALKAQHPQALCTCAYLELTEPDLPAACQSLVAQACTQITVVPMFLGTGRHARNDLPKLVAQLVHTYPQVQFHIATPVGEDPRVTALLASIAAEHLA